jgi:hypothetical protein
MRINYKYLNAILSSALLIPIIPGCTGEIKIEKKSSIESKLEDSNPLENCEAYEIPAGKYGFFIETDSACYPNFKEINYPEGNIYFKKIDPINSFKKPLELTIDYMNQYTLKLGEYEIWVGNNDHYAPVDKLIPLKRNYDIKVSKIKIFKIPLINDEEPKPEEPKAPEAPAPSEAPGLPSAPEKDPSA